MFNRNDRFVGRSLDCYGEWCESEIDLLQRFLRPGDTALDVGANIGSHTVAFAAAAGETGSVLAFEPQRLPFQLLCGNVALNCLANVRCLQKAVGDRKGSAKIAALSPREPHNFGAVSIGEECSASEDVEIVTIDSLALKSCRLIKIDVEGMEPEVIRGARDTIRACQPILFVENNTIDKASRTIAAILDAGYKAWWHLALYYNSANFFHNEENIFAAFKPEANMLCLPEGRDPGIPELIECTGINDNWQMARDLGIAAGNPLFRQR
jgi:FkbM family methyltransferase